MSSVTVRPSPVLGIPIVTYWLTDNDPRGLFAIPYHADDLARAGLKLPPLAQINVSVSDHVGTVRGIHVSNNLKYVTALGAFVNVVVCLDPWSAYFGWHERLYLRTGTAAVIPAGWGNGLVNISAGAVYLYWMDGPFHAPSERVISPVDPHLGIQWLNEPGVSYRISPKDRAGMSLPEYLADPVPLIGGPRDPRELFAVNW